MLSSSDEVQYVYECFHPNGLLRRKNIFRFWFTHLTDEVEPYRTELNKVLAYQYSCLDAFSLFDRSGRFNLRNSPVRLEFYTDCKRMRMTLTHPIPLLKDPIALFSVPWLVEHLRVRPVILIRHPAAFVSSLLRLNWRFDFDNFTNQPNLMKNYLAPFSRILRESKPTDPVEEAALLWNCLHHVIHHYREEYPEWIYRRHEDLSREPLKELIDLHQHLGLRFTAKVEAAIRSSTSSDNRSEVRQGKIHQLKRDSAKNAKNWKNRLSEEQIFTIRKLTDETARHFYSDEDW